jgi:predicted metal-dependent phosphoesterase TrpH
LIDLHTHTTASDGRCSPAALVARAAARRVDVLAVTDHDTLAGCDEAEAACAAAGIRFVNGIEMTAVCDRADVHVLGYFFDRASPALIGFLDEQRRRRVERVREMIAQLARHGVALDAGAILEPALHDARRSAGRPWIARALVEGGYVATTDEAFDRWLARGRPAYVPRTGVGAAAVIARVHEAGGIASLAHPALIARDEWIEAFAADGLDAIEVYHSEHDEAASQRYLAMARRLGLAVTGGSDFHGDPSHGPAEPGAVSLPAEDFEDLVARNSRP